MFGFPRVSSFKDLGSVPDKIALGDAEIALSMRDGHKSDVLIVDLGTGVFKGQFIGLDPITHLVASGRTFYCLSKKYGLMDLKSDQEEGTPSIGENISFDVLGDRGLVLENRGELHALRFMDLETFQEKRDVEVDALQGYFPKDQGRCFNVASDCPDLAVVIQQQGEDVIAALYDARVGENRPSIHRYLRTYNENLGTEYIFPFPEIIQAKCSSIFREASSALFAAYSENEYCCMGYYNMKPERFGEIDHFRLLPKPVYYVAPREILHHSGRHLVLDYTTHLRWYTLDQKTIPAPIVQSSSLVPFADNVSFKKTTLYKDGCNIPVGNEFVHTANDRFYARLMRDNTDKKIVLSLTPTNSQ
jgi:hypothetical protein